MTTDVLLLRTFYGPLKPVDCAGYLAFEVWHFKEIGH